MAGAAWDRPRRPEERPCGWCWPACLRAACGGPWPGCSSAGSWGWSGRRPWPAGRPCGPRPRSSWGPAARSGGLFLSLVGGGLGGLIGLGLALRRRWVPPARLSGLFLTAAVAVLPPGGVLSAGWLPLTRGWGRGWRRRAPRRRAAGGASAPADRPSPRRSRPRGGTPGLGGVPGLALAMAGSLGLAVLGPPLASTGSPPAAVRPVVAGEQGLAAARPAVAAERPHVLLITVDARARSSVPPGAARIVQEGWPPIRGSAIPVATPRAPAMHWPRPD